MTSVQEKKRKRQFEPKPIATVSAKYQIVIPKRFREQMKLKPGDQVCFIYIKGAMRLVPVRPISELRGSLKGANIDFSTIRDKKDREL